jgi:hypothetical protein
MLQSQVSGCTAGGRSVSLYMYAPAIGILGLASVELEVLEVGEELLLDVGLGALLEGSDILGGSVLLLELGLDSFHVACQQHSCQRDSLKLLNAKLQTHEGKTENNQNRNSYP